MDFELVSFKICPYVQRSKITLLHKDVPHATTYIDLADPPQWFQERSPLGLVPILTIDGKDTLFESAVINEYLDEVTGGDMMPTKPIEKARSRAWIEFASSCLSSYAQAAWATDKQGFEEHKAALLGKLKTLEENLEEGPYFHGSQLTLVDTAFAPLWQRLWQLNVDGAIFAPGAYPKIEAWAGALLALPEVQNSIVPEWESIMADYLVNKESWIGQQVLAA